MYWLLQLNKSINFFKKNIADPKFWNGSIYIFNDILMKIQFNFVRPLIWMFGRMLGSTVLISLFLVPGCNPFLSHTRVQIKSEFY